VRRTERWAAAIVALPTSAQFHQRDFVDFLAIGIPVLSSEQPSEQESQPATRAIRVLHCPTDPIGKGSDRIRVAIDRVRARGVAVEYREVVGRPNDEVLQAIQWCDFVVDELYSDTPMAKFGAEAAHFGKPAVVGSYAAELYQRSGANSVPPSQLCHPDALEGAIYELATDPVRCNKLGAEARAFVTNEWAPARVAERLMTLVSGSCPSAWIVRAKDLRYVHGWGMPELVLVRTLAELLNVATPGDLGIPVGTQVEANLRKLAAKAGTMDTNDSRDR
jgi:glycosyltransferase involved in cell wall biosynthesis